MKLTYRGVSYDYNPPTVEFSNSDTVGKYRGLDIRFRNPVKVPVQQATLDLFYRGAAYQTVPAAKTIEPAVAPTVQTAPPATVSTPVVASVDRARSLMMNNSRFIKQRQQVMLSRLATEVGLTAGDAARYWNHIQGKVHPSFRATYDRSHAALS